MIRKIECLNCFRSLELLPDEDSANGWKRRVHRIQALTKDCQCDLCNAPIPQGTEARVVTLWNENRESEPLYWENDYQ